MTPLRAGLAHANLEPQNATLARLHGMLQLPAQNERARIVRLRIELSVDAAPGAARHVLEASREIVDNRHVVDRLVPNVIVPQRDLHLFPGERIAGRRQLAEPQPRTLRSTRLIDDSR